MKISRNGINNIVKYEGIRLKPYLCSANIPTIGIGSTRYEDGTRVKMTDKSITLERVYELFYKTIEVYENVVNKVIKSNINQNQFDALVSLCYNIGGSNFSISTLVKRVNKNPNDATIKDAFLMWNKGGGKVLKGLIKRREDEAQLYFDKNNY